MITIKITKLVIPMMRAGTSQLKDGSNVSHSLLLGLQYPVEHE
jgi:hypothetical protein